MLKNTRVSDPELYKLACDELHQQEKSIQMIASESLAPLEVLELCGSVFGNIALEGYPGKRFHAGAANVDKLEFLAIERAKELYKADHVNIQTYSGSTANYSVFAAVLEKDDTVLCMSLDQGGHLTHGSPANWTNKFFRHEFYGIDPVTETIDYDELEKKAKEVRPKLIIAGASSYPRLIDFERMAKIAKDVGAYFMVDMAHIAGLVAADLIPSPIPHADFVASSTTKTFCGPRDGGMVFCKAEHAKLLDKGTFPGSIGGMHVNSMAAKAWCFKYEASEEFRSIMKQVLINGKTLAEELTKHGFRVVSGTTDTHLVLVDTQSKGMTGKDFQNALEKAGIMVNKNMIPFDTASPFTTSGVRIGVTVITQRGMKEAEIKEIVDIMDQVAAAPQDEANLAACRAKSEALISRFPLYPAGSFDD